MRRDRYSELANKLLPHLPQLAPVVRISGGGEGGVDPGVITFDDIDGQLGEGQALWVDVHIEDAIAQFKPHGMLDAVYHSVEGAQYSIIGLTDTDTLGLLQSTADGGTNHNTILRSGSSGDLALDILTAPGDLFIDPVGELVVGLGVQVYTEDYTADGVAGWRLAAGNFDGVAVTANEIVARQSMYAAATGFRVIHHTHDYDHAHVVVNPGPFWNLDEQFGVDIDDNLLVRGYIVGKHAIQLPGAMMICHYDGAEPYETNFTGNATGHMGQTSSETAIIYRPGKFGKGAQVARGGSNGIANPSFENGDANWTGFGWGTGTRGVSAARALYGSYAYRIIKSGGDNIEDYGIFTTVTTTPGQAYTASVWLFVEAMSGTLPEVTLSFQNNLQTQDERDSLTIPANEWVRLSVTMTPTTDWCYFFVFLNNGYGTFYADAAQLEPGSIATPYIDGSLGSGHSWVGAAHGSASQRIIGSSISYNARTVISPTAITTGCWVRRSNLAPGYLIAHPSVTLEFL